MARKKKVKPFSFRIYPEGRYLYCEVNIWPTKKTMYAHGAMAPGYDASCGGRMSYIVPAKGDGRIRRTGLFAEANFSKRYLGIGVVSHEMSHAAFCFAERRKLQLERVNDDREAMGWKPGGNKEILDQDGPEERFCYALGEMCRQFTQKLYDLGVYEATVENVNK